MGAQRHMETHKQGHKGHCAMPSSIGTEEGAMEGNVCIKRQKWTRKFKNKRVGDRENQNKQRRGEKRSWARKAKENTGKDGRRKPEEEEEGTRFPPKRNPPWRWAPENPGPGHSPLLLPLSCCPLPLCPARPCSARLRWLPCGRFIFKNADAVPRLPGPHTVATRTSAKPRDPTQLWGGREG